MKKQKFLVYSKSGSVVKYLTTIESYNMWVQTKVTAKLFTDLQSRKIVFSLNKGSGSTYTIYGFEPAKDI